MMILVMISKIMRPSILAFAAKSTHQAIACIKLVQTMKFVGQQTMDEPEVDDSPLVFFDVEVYPNLFVVCWKTQGSDTVVRMINPTGEEIEPLFSQKLVGFNNRRYDNHILYARYLGYSLEGLFNLSQNDHLQRQEQQSIYCSAKRTTCLMRIFTTSARRSRTLKRFQIDLDIHHMELDLPWDTACPGR